MKKRYHFCPKIWLQRSFLTAAAALLSLSLFAQTTFTKQWEKSFGGKGDDFLWDVKATSDGGVIMGGSSNSGIEGGKSQANKNFYDDIWVIKLDAQGNKQWDKTIGGTYGDEIRKLHQTADGGYILFGESWSEVSGDKSESCRGRPDFWLVKLDANGNKVWDRTYGGSSDEIPRELKITPDGGYILTGESYSGKSGDKTQGNGAKDYWIVKADSKGNKIWDTVLPIKHKSEIRNFDLTADKGFLVSGLYLPSFRDKSGKDSTGRTDFWLIKLNEKGKEVWNKHYGTGNYDFLMSVEQTSDGGYILGGNTELRNGGKENAACLIMKLDGNGTKIWEKTIGTSLDEQLRTIQETPDKGFIVAGFSGQTVAGSMDIYDSWLAEYYWIAKLDENGNKVWEEKFESPRDQLGNLLQMPDKGFLLTGSYSRKDENQAEEDVFNGDPPKRINETWVTKVDPKGKKLWSTRIRRKEHHTYDTPVLTKDGGFVLWGQELPEQDEADYWIVKFGTGTAAAQTQSAAPNNVYEKAEQMPVYPGGEAALKAYFLKALAPHKYPKGSTVTLKLVIDRSGQPKDFEVLTGLNQEADALVLEAARKMPKWQPGKQKGQPVSVRLNIPVPLSGQTPEAAADVVEDVVYSFVQQEPAFPGGQISLLAFLKSIVKYPEEAKAKKTEGRVVLSFVVGKDGAVKDTQILKRLSPEIDAEAIRLMKSMPAWIPGKQNGQAVNVRVTLPIFFTLDKLVEIN